jgi:hypothetical protein
MNLTTPALLFPAISLLLLAYTNRFVVLTGVIRSLASKGDCDSRELIRRQVASFRRRLSIIRAMQLLGVASFVFCTLSMFGLFLGQLAVGQAFFGLSLLLLLASLLCSMVELWISTNAIFLEIQRMDLD